MFEHWKALARNCPFRTRDNKGFWNCTYHDSSIGYCTLDLCPLEKQIEWQYKSTRKIIGTILDINHLDKEIFVFGIDIQLPYIMDVPDEKLLSKLNNNIWQLTYKTFFASTNFGTIYSFILVDAEPPEGHK